MRFSIVIVLIVLVGCSSQKVEEQSGFEISDIKLTNLEGKEIDLTLLEGKTVFINFWATWCRPCIQEMPSIALLQDKLAGANIEFLFASDEEVERILKFKDSRGMNLNFVRVENPEALGIEALPTTFIFDKKGELVFSEVGLRKWDDPATIEMVTKLINE